jgi:hypothetical protein
VIVVNFDGGELLRRCVDSVFAAIQDPAEIIIVDNASSDGSAAGAARDREGVHILRNATNVGFPKAVNQGLAEAAGERVLLLNPDAEIPAGLFRAAAKGLEPTGPFALLTFAQQEDPECRASTGPLMSTGEIVGQLLLRRRGRARIDPPVVIAGESFCPVRDGYLSGYCLAATRGRLQALGGLDPRLFWAEDVDLSARARAAGATLAVCTSTAVIHERSYSRRRNAALVTFFQLTSKIGYARRHSPRHAPLIVLVVAGTAGLRWVWLTLAGRHDPAARDKARAYRAVLRHVRTRAWRRPEGWDPAVVEALRTSGAAAVDTPEGDRGER